MSRSQQQIDTRDELLERLMRSEKNLSRISIIFRSVIANRFGMNATDAECLDYLIDMGPVPTGKLAKITGLTEGAITNVVDRLQKAGFVNRQSDPEDRRKVIVALVQEKIEPIAEVYRPTVMKIFNLYMSYSDEEMRFLLRFYSDLIQIYQDGIDSAGKQL